MTFTNAIVNDWEFSRQGNYFIGPGGSLLVHRAGYEFRPAAAAVSAPGGAAAPPAQPRRVPWRENDNTDAWASTAAHTRNFLDCVKSREKPVSELEIGFYATLPTLLAVRAIREGRAFTWDDAAGKATAV